MVSTGVINQGVNWLITGNESTGSYVSDTGKVHIAKDEAAEMLTAPVSATPLVLLLRLKHM